jgi:hypothetical protein
MIALETPARPMNVQTMPLPEGDAGTAITIAQMQRLIDEGSKDPAVHELAASILTSQRVRAFDFAGEARAIYNWVLRHIRFTRDIRGKETLHAARETIRLAIGDCDDFTILTLALAQSIGHRGRIVTVASDARDPETFSHVYPEVAINGRWVALDAARRSPGFGKTPNNPFRKCVWDAASPEFQDVAGLGMPMVMPMRGHARAVNSPAYYTPPDSRRAMRQRRRLRGLGDGVDWSDPSTWTGISNMITSGSTAAANIISAARATPYNLVPSTLPGVASRAPAPVYADYSGGAYPGTFGGISTGTLLIGAIVLVGIFAAVRR